MKSADLNEHPDLPETPATPSDIDCANAAHCRASRHLREEELARRWRISARTLQRWRRQGRAPAHLRIGHSILYRCADVEAFERHHLRGEEAKR